MARHPVNDQPRWHNGCDCCTFLGRSADGRADLYLCYECNEPALYVYLSPRGRHSTYSVGYAERAILHGTPHHSRYAVECYGKAKKHGLLLG